jgi:gamma-glutamylaminecyclotransferase
VRVIRVFVYGTLRRGGRGNRLLRGCRYLAESTTDPGFELVDMGPYPGLVAGGAVAVRGEIWEVPSDLLAELDAYEGEEYARVAIRLADGSQAQAWVMHAHHTEGRPRIAGGEWRR